MAKNNKVHKRSVKAEGRRLRIRICQRILVLWAESDLNPALARFALKTNRVLKEEKHQTEDKKEE